MSASDEVRLCAVSAEGPVPLAVPADARSAHEVLDGCPLGVYTGLRTFHHTRFLGLEEHLERTDRCMELLGWKERLDRRSVRLCLHEAVCAFPAEDTFVRLDVLADEPSRLDVPGRTVLALSPVRAVPESFLREGVRVEVARELKRPDPRIKTADFVVSRRPYPLNRQDAYEHLLLDERGRILECTSANFYALIDGEVRTARRHMLEGITRRYVLRLCGELGLPVRQDPPAVAELASASEAFLTSSTRGVVPVVDVAGQAIGSGAPGPSTLELIAAYGALVEREAAPAWPPPHDASAGPRD